MHPYFDHVFKLVGDNALRIGIRIKLHSFCAVYEYDLSNKKSATLEQLMPHRLKIAKYDYVFQPLALVKYVIYWGVKFFMALYVKTALLYFNHFTIGSQLNSLNISADGVL